MSITFETKLSKKIQGFEIITPQFSKKAEDRFGPLIIQSS